MTDPETATRLVFQDRHRTSPTNGILKTEAVMQFCRAFASSELEQFADVTDGSGHDEAREGDFSRQGPRFGRALELSLRSVATITALYLAVWSFALWSEQREGRSCAR